MKHSPISQSLSQLCPKASDEKDFIYLTEREDIMKRVSVRTVELAVLAGRASHQIRQGDYEQAKREISYDVYQFRL
jgi:hypothetical protein